MCIQVFAYSERTYIVGMGRPTCIKGQNRYSVLVCFVATHCPVDDTTKKTDEIVYVQKEGQYNVLAGEHLLSKNS